MNTEGFRGRKRRKRAIAKGHSLWCPNKAQTWPFMLPSCSQMLDLIWFRINKPWLMMCTILSESDSQFIGLRRRSMHMECRHYAGCIFCPVRECTGLQKSSRKHTCLRVMLKRGIKFHNLLIFCPSLKPLSKITNYKCTSWFLTMWT